MCSHTYGGGAEREEASKLCTFSTEPDMGLSLMTGKSCPEPISRVPCLTCWASQAPPKLPFFDKRFFLVPFLKFLYPFRERERQRERERTSGGGAEREGESENPKQAPHCQCGAQMGGSNPRSCEVMTWPKTKIQMLNQVSHPGAPLWQKIWSGLQEIHIIEIQSKI